VSRITATFVPYAMNKDAIDVVSHTVAQALGARGITVNTVSPGVTDTDMGAWVHSAAGLEEQIVSTIALGRLGVPTDIADVVAFLASRDARWVTSVAIDTSGGSWLGPKAA
jgi:3-oxoacyl-[acyl-carrier protein] reductase